MRETRGRGFHKAPPVSEPTGYQHAMWFLSWALGVVRERTDLRGNLVAELKALWHPSGDVWKTAGHPWSQGSGDSWPEMKTQVGYAEQGEQRSRLQGPSHLRLRSVSRDQGVATRGVGGQPRAVVSGRQGRKPGEEEGVAHSVNSS